VNAKCGKLAGRILAILFLTAPFLAADQFGDFTYTDDGLSITITDYPTTATGAVVIPETIAGKPVTAIGSYAFSGCASVTDVMIPQTVDSIGSSAFLSCGGLTSLTLPAGLTSIENSTFWGCGGLTSVPIPAGVTRVGDNAFTDCSNMTNISLPASLMNIGQNAFSRCIKLTVVTIPANVTSIGTNAFSGCTGLSAIEVDPGNLAYSSAGGVLFDKSKTRVIRYPAAASASYTIPSSVTVIDDFAFSSCKNLVSVTLPASVNQIGRSAFAYCQNLAGVTLPGGLTTIGDDAFNGCKSLKCVTIPAGVTRLGTYAFAFCEVLESVSILSNAPIFGWLAFRDSYMLRTMSFAGNAPTVDRDLAKSPLPLLQVYYFNGKTGFTSPTWYGYPTVNMGSETPVASWLIGNGLPFDSDLNSDPNQDGVNLLMAYALDLDPNKNLAGSMPRPVIAGNQLSLRFFAGRADVTYNVLASEDMVRWAAEGVTISAPDENQFRTATVAVSGRGRFLRLLVEE
jgi:hypothetical protein